ncbi:hypothetical protein ABPG74_013310 [Tetrahymena malaccensis]
MDPTKTNHYISKSLDIFASNQQRNRLYFKKAAFCDTKQRNNQLICMNFINNKKQQLKKNVKMINIRFYHKNVCINFQQTIIHQVKKLIIFMSQPLNVIFKLIYINQSYAAFS